MFEMKTIKNLKRKGKGTDRERHRGGLAAKGSGGNR